MITADYARLMARYNRWQNGSLVAAADGLDDGARRADRGAFFGSIQATLNHVLWGDRIWMSRFADWEKPAGGIAESPQITPDWESYKAARLRADADIVDWANGLTDADLAGDLSWYSGSLQADMVNPMALCVAHFFNHQTHHRGQVHAMLTAAGARPEATDLFIMPESA
ncbi:DinB family protein [Psychromarinibacter sp. C21-152]|uniref:DinB family protein n=1 Tax=Psychromarinibacter sediminicola TaxID=3033385 RepID=A0AAE3NTB1_9RHOB|nr:DinB family protein [Psychromarinibacter sediminicola]MDF0602029.1 DinB family protein [Psychromarinibacter sediminicola]